MSVCQLHEYKYKLETTRETQKKLWHQPQNPNYIRQDLWFKINLYQNYHKNVGSFLHPVQDIRIHLSNKK